MKKLLLIMSLLGLFTSCKSQETGDNKKEQPTMPQGKLISLDYNYGGMRMEQFSDFSLQRKKDGTGALLKFRHYKGEVKYEVSDTLLDAAKRIIEEEKMYEYAVSYALKSINGERILDGYSWHFYALFENKDAINSSGSNASPGGEGLHRISALLSAAAQQCIDNDPKEQP
ncbi:MAG: hypothetical protein IKH26_13640 [Bacteroidaceae bacterium]|nr:hypothetical protein [Bacteroidaceae bacterium]